MLLCLVVKSTAIILLWYMSYLGGIMVSLGSSQWVLKVTFLETCFHHEKIMNIHVAVPLSFDCSFPTWCMTTNTLFHTLHKLPTWHQGRPTLYQVHFTGNLWMWASTTLRQKSVQLTSLFFHKPPKLLALKSKPRSNLDMLFEISEDETLWCQKKALILRVSFWPSLKR